MTTDHLSAFQTPDRVAVVVGAGGGLGRECALTLAQAGSVVLLADLPSERLDESLELAQAINPDSVAVTVDVSDKASVDRLAERAMESFGRIDSWSNVAGVLSRGPAQDITPEELTRVLSINFGGVVWGALAAARVMTAAGSGSIVNVSSTAGDMASPHVALYGASKAAVTHFTKTLATEVGPLGVRVNGIAPGYIETPMTASGWVRDGVVDDDLRSSIIGRRADEAALRKTGHPSDVAYAMLYLCCDASEFMTGQTLRPDGGVSMA